MLAANSKVLQKMNINIIKLAENQGDFYHNEITLVKLLKNYVKTNQCK